MTELNPADVKAGDWVRWECPTCHHSHGSVWLSGVAHFAPPNCYRLPCERWEEVEGNDGKKVKVRTRAMKLYAPTEEELRRWTS